MTNKFTRVTRIGELDGFRATRKFSFADSNENIEKYQGSYEEKIFLSDIRHI